MNGKKIEFFLNLELNEYQPHDCINTEERNNIPNCYDTQNGGLQIYRAQEWLEARLTENTSTYIPI